MYFIESERLKMIPLTHGLLQLLHTERAAMELTLGLNISSYQVDELYAAEIEDAMVNFWLPKTLANPEAYRWYTGWEIILKSDNISVGGMGFIGEPNEQGQTEIGYMIDQQQQNKGYATEALRLLSGWAFEDARVNTIIVHTYADNMPSRRILAKCGFAEIWKKEDGLMCFNLKITPD